MSIDYFAYGANIDVPAMRRRCPTAVCLGTALLHDHKPASMREGWLTVAAVPGWVTPGLLWSLEPTDIEALDEYEDVATGLYLKERRAVVRASDGQSVDVMMYLGMPDERGTLHSEYAHRVGAAIRRELSLLGEISERTADLIEALSRPEHASGD